MNRAFALVWNHSLGAWTVASEHARRHGRRGTSRAAAGALALGIAALHPACALGADLPTGGSVVSGSASIASDGTAMTIDQASHKAVIDWSSFDIGAGNSVTFVQPSSASSALNRVTGGDASSLYGTLNANGQVYLINPNGILFGASAQVNVGTLVASTLDIANDDFERGRYAFQGNGGNASVVNHGSLRAADGGAVALLGGTVSNQGVIVANRGTVALAAGNAVTLDFAGDGLLNVQVDEAVIDALVENRQLIQADGGGVILTAQASDALLQTVVNNSGVIEARTLGEREGRIVLLGGDSGSVQVAGTLDASATDGGDGGFVETSGAHVQVADTAVVTTKADNGTTGTWLIDPTDFTVSAGSASQTDSGIGADTLSANLQNTSVTLATVSSGSEAGDINVNAAVGWDASTTLTFNAHGDININAAITATGESAGLVLNHGGYAQNGTAATGSDYHVNAPVTLSGGNASLSINGNAYSLIHSMAELTSISGTGRYALAQSLDASGTTYGSAPVGTLGGTFAGLGNTIGNLSIAGSSSNVGLFGATGSGSSIRDLGLADAAVSGGDNVGILAGLNAGAISNAWSAGSVTSGGSNIGGLVGSNQASGTVDASRSDATVSGGNVTGGLVGQNYGSIANTHASGNVIGTSDNIGGLVGWSGGSISDAYATGSVSGYAYVGGLVGGNTSGSIARSYATGTVTGFQYVGGLLGRNAGTGSITQSYATGAVTGTGSSVGGLVGLNYATSGSTASITQSYATGVVTETSSYSYVGGLVGLNYAASGSTASITQSYATGAVTGTGSVGGLVGYNYATSGSTASITQSQWDSGTTGQTSAVGTNAGGTVTDVTAVTAASRYSRTAYSALGTWTNLYGSVWGASDGTGNLWVMIEGSTRPFLASEYSTTIRNAHQLQLMVYDLSARYTLAADIDASETDGSNASGMWSTAGFDPIGNDSNYFAGSLDGQSHVVSGLTIDRPTQHFVGLFGYIGSAGSITDVGLVDAEVSGNHSVGALAGVNGGSIGNAYTTGSVSGGDYYSGGLAGVNFSGSISNAYTSSSVSGGSYVGGVVGYNDYGSISNAYATGNVSGNYAIGGLAGFNFSGSISNAYATGSVSGNNSVGGLLGYNVDVIASSISNAFYATTDAFGNAINTGLSSNDYGTAKTYAELQQSSTFAAWDLATSGGSSGVWRIYDGYTTPLLRSLLKSVTVTVGDVDGKTYDGTSVSVSGSSYSLSDASAVLLGSASYASVTARDAGTYALGLTGLYSDQQGYDIIIVDGGYTIDKVALTVTANDAGKTYDGLAWSGGNGVSYSGFVNGEDASVLGGGLSYGGSAQGSVDAGSYSIAADGLAADNYSITYVDGTLVVDPKAITVTANGGSSTYGDSNLVNPGLSADGLVNGETVDVLTGLTNSFALGHTSNAGSYVLTVEGTLTNGNYVVTQTTDGTWVVDPKAITVTANGGSSTYGDSGLANPGLSAEGLVNGETVDVLSGLTNSFALDHTSGASTYVLSVEGTLTNGNYVVTQTSDGTWVVDPKAITVTANGGSSTYGDTGLSNPGLSADGLVNGETVEVLTGLTNNFALDHSSNAGSHVLTVEGTLSNGNYVVTQTSNGTWVVDPKQITVTANGGSSTYGDSGLSNPGLSADGLVNGETVAVLTGLGNSFALDHSSNAGSYVLTVDGTLINGNYLVTQTTNGTWVVDKASLVVTANDAAKTYDGIAFSGGNGVSYSGFVNDEDASVLGGSLSYAGSAQGAIDAGTYSIAADGLTADNYAISYADGTLSINAQSTSEPPAAQPDSPSATYTDILSSLPPDDNADRSIARIDVDPPYRVVASGIRLPEGI
ncbi:MBG domain-containing protein [Pseudomonas lopnurensis]|uniref:MBG domain-containing protein n=1 Tax=Pseudomonas lopnurensis TaxID=1477517 RepID=UPI0028AFDAB7|nr:MBG domain-containing protein [Pseudomonas lopnurensis]